MENISGHSPRQLKEFQQWQDMSTKHLYRQKAALLVLVSEVKGAVPHVKGAVPHVVFDKLERS